MANNNSSTNTGIGFTSLLLLAFIILKLCKVINWPWWLVLSPFWIPVAIVVLCLIVYGFLRWRSTVKAKERLRKKIGEWQSGKEPKEPKSKWEQRLEDIQKRNKF